MWINVHPTTSKQGLIEKIYPQHVTGCNTVRIIIWSVTATNGVNAYFIRYTQTTLFGCLRITYQRMRQYLVYILLLDKNTIYYAVFCNSA